MSSVDKSVGVLAGKIASREGLASGMLSSLDADTIARAVSENPRFLERLVGSLDAEVIAGAINSNPGFMVELVRNLDPAALAESINSNQKFALRLTENLEPNLFTRLASQLFIKVRRATVKPTLRPVDEDAGNLLS